MAILLVEDDTAQLESLQTALSQAGHIVDVVANGAVGETNHKMSEKAKIWLTNIVQAVS